MSEIPALRDALVRAGERRRRRRRTLGAAVPTFAVAAAAVFFLAIPSAPDPERTIEPGMTPLARDFAVFARPQTADDRAPASELAWRVKDVDVDPALTRHVGGDVFALATRAQDVVCLMVLDVDQRLNGPCTRLREARGEHLGLRLTTDTTVALLVPNGTRDATAEYEGGSRVKVPIRDNAVIVPLPDTLITLSWTSPRDVRHVLRQRGHRTFLDRRCPAELSPLPPNAAAEAARVALNDLDRIDATAATGTIRRAEVGPETGCADAVSERTVTVTLATDSRPRKLRVLVGVVDGVLQPYRVMR